MRVKRAAPQVSHGPHELHSGLIAYRVLRPLVVPLYRSWLCSRAKRLAGPELVGHIQIITEIERHVDHEDVCDIVALLKSSARREPRQFLVVDRNAEERGQDETMVQMDSFEKIEAKLSVKNALKEKLSMREERMTPTSPRSAVFLRPFRTPPSSPRSMKGV